MSRLGFCWLAVLSACSGTLLLMLCDSDFKKSGAEYARPKFAGQTSG